MYKKKKTSKKSPKQKVKNPDQDNKNIFENNLRALQDADISEIYPSQGQSSQEVSAKKKRAAKGSVTTPSQVDLQVKSQVVKIHKMNDEQIYKKFKPILGPTVDLTNELKTNNDDGSCICYAAIQHYNTLKRRKIEEVDDQIYYQKSVRYLTRAFFEERLKHTIEPGDDFNKKIIYYRKYLENEQKNDEGYEEFIKSQRSKDIIKRTFSKQSESLYQFRTSNILENIKKRFSKQQGKETQQISMGGRVASGHDCAKDKSQMAVEINSQGQMEDQSERNMKFQQLNDRESDNLDIKRIYTKYFPSTNKLLLKEIDFVTKLKEIVDQEQIKKALYDMINFESESCDYCKEEKYRKRQLFLHSLQTEDHNQAKPSSRNHSDSCSSGSLNDAGLRKSKGEVLFQKIYQVSTKNEAQKQQQSLPFPDHKQGNQGNFERRKNQNLLRRINQNLLRSENETQDEDKCSITNEPRNNKLIKTKYYNFPYDHSWE